MVGETATAAGKESTVRQTFGGPPHFGRNDIASRMRFKDPLVAISFLPLQGGGELSASAELHPGAGQRLVPPIHARDAGIPAEEEGAFLWVRV